MNTVRDVMVEVLERLPAALGHLLDGREGLAALTVRVTCWVLRDVGADYSGDLTDLTTRVRRRVELRHPGLFDGAESPRGRHRLRVLHVAVEETLHVVAGTARSVRASRWAEAHSIRQSAVDD